MKSFPFSPFTPLSSEMSQQEGGLERNPALNPCVKMEKPYAVNEPGSHRSFLMLLPTPWALGLDCCP